MPIHIDQKKLRLIYIFINCYAGILAMAPLAVALDIAHIALFGMTFKTVGEIVLIALFFPIVARFVFNKHKMIIYLFEGKYEGKDKDKLRTLFNMSWLIRLYDKIPLPYVELNPRVKRWRQYK